MCGCVHGLFTEIVSQGLWLLALSIHTAVRGLWLCAWSIHTHTPSGTVSHGMCGYVNGLFTATVEGGVGVGGGATCMSIKAWSIKAWSIKQSIDWEWYPDPHVSNKALQLTKESLARTKPHVSDKPLEMVLMESNLQAHMLTILQRTARVLIS